MPNTRVFQSPDLMQVRKSVLSVARDVSRDTPIDLGVAKESLCAAGRHRWSFQRGEMHNAVKVIIRKGKTKDGKISFSQEDKDDILQEAMRGNNLSAFKFL